MKTETFVEPFIMEDLANLAREWKAAPWWRRGALANKIAEMIAFNLRVRYIRD